MTNSTNISAQPQNNNGQPQRPRNIGGSQNAVGLLPRTLNSNTGMRSLIPQNARGLLQRAQNAGIQSLRLQNTTNLSVDAFDEVQQKYTDLIGGADLFPKIHGMENPAPQDIQFQILLILGDSFP
ncbi:2022_t:CDS:1, partial [Dentiscutata heterogama]